jgi:predicted RNase H-like HicB family nuclease
MPKYEIRIVWSQTDGAYLAKVPELPGCMADGKTYEEALHNAEVVINEWIETAHSLGRSVPSPQFEASDLNEAKQQREYAFA